MSEVDERDFDADVEAVCHNCGEQYVFLLEKGIPCWKCDEPLDFLRGKPRRSGSKEIEKLIGSTGSAE